MRWAQHFPYHARIPFSTLNYPCSASLSAARPPFLGSALGIAVTAIAGGASSCAFTHLYVPRGRRFEHGPVRVERLELEDVVSLDKLPSPYGT